MERNDDLIGGHTISEGPSSAELSSIESGLNGEAKTLPLDGTGNSGIISAEDLYWIPFNHRRLTDEEVAAYSIRKAAGDIEARNELVLCNLRIVPYVARKFGLLDRGLSNTDLYQEGIIGLMKAVDKFEHARGFKLSTYAIWWIRQAMYRAIANQSSEIRLPVNRRAGFTKIQRSTAELFHKLGRRPTLSEISEATGFSIDQIDSLMSGSGRVVCSIHQTISHDDGETEIGALIPDALSPDPLEVLIRKESLQSLEGQGTHLKQVLDKLTISERDKGMFSYFYSLDGGSTKIPKSLEIVGARFGVTRERTRQILESVWCRLVRHDPGLQSVRIALSVQLNTNVGGTRDFIPSARKLKQSSSRIARQERESIRCFRASPAFVRWTEIGPVDRRFEACFAFVAHAYELKVDGFRLFGPPAEVRWAKSVAAHIASEALGLSREECARTSGTPTKELASANDHLIGSMANNPSVRSDIERMVAHFKGLIA